LAVVVAMAMAVAVVLVVARAVARAVVGAVPHSLWQRPLRPPWRHEEASFHPPLWWGEWEREGLLPWGGRGWRWRWRWPWWWRLWWLGRWQGRCCIPPVAAS
jgi:hypothetical protein